MKKRLILTSLLASYCILTFAQAQENQAATQTYKNDVGLNASSMMPGIFSTGSTSPFTIIYKRYKSDTSAIRFGLSGFSTSNKVDNANGNANYNNLSETSFSVLVGKEFQKHINQKWTWYYGGDLVPYYAHSHISNYSNGLQYLVVDASNLGLSFKPFLGIRYNINSRLYVSAESSLQASISMSRNSYKYLENSSNSSDKNGHNSSVTFVPSTGVFLFYRF